MQDQVVDAAGARRQERDVRSRALTRAGFAVVVMTYAAAVLGVVHPGTATTPFLAVAAACCVAATVLVFCRAYQVAIAS